MVGPILNAACIVTGSISGAVIGNRIRPEFRVKINYVFACVTTALGVYMVSKAKSMPPAVIAILMGTAVGELVRLDANIMRLAFWAVGVFQRRRKPSSAAAPENVFRDQFSVLTVLFCFSVLGTIGPMQEGMTGDYSLLLIKSLLDLFTALIFAANIGGITAVLAVPQTLFQTSLFFLATAILPLISPTMLADFSTCGGIIMLGTALRQFGLVEVPILSMLPSLFIIMPFSAFWTHLMG